jgi:cytochrome c5
MPPADQLLLASAKVALPAGVRTEELPDANILQTFCVTCHALPSPAMHSATDWPGVVRRMWLRMDLLDPQYRVPTPELGQRIVLLDYLTNHALKVSDSTLPDTPEREFFQKTCAQCHELPDPRQHSTQDWYVVVRRMNQHMRDILGKELTSEEIERIVRYLVQASA